MAMRSGCSPGPKSILGLAASRLGVTMPLKACPECMLEDKRKDLVAWWHLEHQWPSVRVCLRHAQLLLVAQNKLHVRTLKDWWLPEDLDNRHWWTASQVGKEQLQELLRIAEWTAFLVKQGHSNFEQDLLRYAYLLRAQQRGWIAMDGSVRLQALKHAFARSYQGLAQLPGLSFLGTITDVNAGILGLLLRQFPSARHPVKHIYLMAFLFEEPAEFFGLYRHVKAMAKSGGTTLLDEQLQDQIAQLRRMIVEEGRSVNAAASELGVTPTQAIRHLDSEGIPYKKRSRVLSPKIEKMLQVLLKAGKERQEISSALGIRMGFIKDYLTRQPQLKSAWTKARHGRRKKEYRRCFLRVLRNNPGVPMKQIKRINSNGFQWLYRNDREWLVANLPTVT